MKSIPGSASLNEAGDTYVYNGPLTDRETQDDFSFYAQDTWRWKPTVTLTYGVRYQYTLPMSPANSAFSTITTTDACGVSGVVSGAASADGSTTRFCNMFQPGVFLNPTAPAPTYVNYSKGNKGYNTDLNNLAPLGGVAWRPNVQSGWVRKLLGDPELATINGGFTRSYVRNKLDNFRNVYLAGPGASIPASRSTSSTAFPLVDTAAGQTWPILFSEKNRLGEPPFNSVPAYPYPASPTIVNVGGMTGVCTNCSSSANLFNPDIQVPWTDSWNVSLQRCDHEGHGVRGSVPGQSQLRCVDPGELGRDKLDNGLEPPARDRRLHGWRHRGQSHGRLVQRANGAG